MLSGHTFYNSNNIAYIHHRVQFIKSGYVQVNDLNISTISPFSTCFVEIWVDLFFLMLQISENILFVFESICSKRANSIFISCTHHNVCVCTYPQCTFRLNSLISVCRKIFTKVLLHFIRNIVHRVTETEAETESTTDKFHLFADLLRLFR